MSQPVTPDRITHRLWQITLIFLITFIVLELLARVVVSLEVPRQGLPMALHRKFALAEKYDKKKRDSVILLGTSLMFRSVYPELLSMRLRKQGVDLDIRNLASSANSPAINLHLLQSVLEHGKTSPRMVIYNVVPSQFLSPKMNYRIEKPYFKSYLYQCQVSHNKSTLEKGLCGIKKVSYLVRYQSYFKTLISEDLTDMLLKPDKKGLEVQGGKPTDVEYELSTGGWGPSYPVYTDAEYRQKFFKHLEQSTKKTGWATPDFEPITKLCAEHNIPLVLVWLPYHPLKDEISGQGPVNKTAEREHISQYATQQPNVYFIDLSSRDTNTEHYRDLGHANVAGAIHTTNLLGELLLSHNYRTLLTSDKNISQAGSRGQTP